MGDTRHPNTKSTDNAGNLLIGIEPVHLAQPVSFTLPYPADRMVAIQSLVKDRWPGICFEVTGIPFVYRVRAGGPADQITRMLAHLFPTVPNFIFGASYDLGGKNPVGGNPVG